MLDNLHSSLLGNEIGLGILDFPEDPEDDGLRINIRPPEPVPLPPPELVPASERS